jgi:hypothetical protein
MAAIWRQSEYEQQKATQGEACKANAETPQKAGASMITNRFILKNGQMFDHTVSETVSRRIHEMIGEQHLDVITVSDGYDNVTISVVRSDIVAYINIS